MFGRVHDGRASSWTLERSGGGFCERDSPVVSGLEAEYFHNLHGWLVLGVSILTTWQDAYRTGLLRAMAYGVSALVLSARPAHGCVDRFEQRRMARNAALFASKDK